MKIEKTKKPEWLQKRMDFKSMKEMGDMLRSLNLNTVCEGARCPNMGECFKNKTATFMILGSICTRNCRFCAIEQLTPTPVDSEEPRNVALASKKLGLRHVVVTSVTRDDLADQGAKQFAQTVLEIKKELPKATIELLIPDMNMKEDCLKIVADSKPTILNHNIETVPALYDDIRPMADYRQSLDVLKYFREKSEGIYTKSGIMVGLGETREEVLDVLKDLRSVDCDILTIGQYLPPSKNHAKLVEYVTPETFDFYKEEAEKLGFKFVASGPYVRSSYQAAESIGQL
jgi:lipoic acid synthetase